MKKYLLWFAMKPATSYFIECPLVLLLWQWAVVPPLPPLPLMILKTSIMLSLVLSPFHATKDPCSPAVQSAVNFFILRNSLDSFGSRLKRELQDQACGEALQSVGCWWGSWPPSGWSFLHAQESADTFTHLTCVRRYSRWDQLPFRSNSDK